MTFWKFLAVRTKRAATRVRHSPNRSRRCLLALEALEDRLLLSNWTFMGPAPLANGSTAYTEKTTGRVTAIAASPTDANLLYIGSASGGVWKTTDGGVHWTPLTDTQSTLSIGAIALAPSNPNIIYTGTGEANMGPSKFNPDANKYRDNIYYGRGVLKSVDAGATWTLLGQAQFDRRTISKIVVDPADANTIYLAVGAVATNGLTGNTGVWKSTDGGATWNVMVNGITDFAATDAVSDLVMDPSNDQTLYAAVGTPGGSAVNSVYKTTDGGSTWARAGNFPIGQDNASVGRITIAIAPSAPQTLYASIAASGQGPQTVGRLVDIYDTTDGGQNWTPLFNKTFPEPNYLSFGGDYHSTLAVAPKNANIVYAGGQNLIASTDGGSSWSDPPIAPGDTTGPHHDHHAVGFDAAGHFLDGNDGGIWRLDSLAPVAWSNLNGNLGVVQFNSIALHPSNKNIAYGGTQDNGTEKYFDDGGDPTNFWKRSERGDGGPIAVSSVNPDNRIYHIRTGFQSGDPNFLRRSLDGGATWVTHVSGINTSDPKNFYPPLVVHPVPVNGWDRLVLGTDHVYVSLDGANNWTAIGGPDPDNFPSWNVSDVLDSLAVAPSETTALGTIYASAGGHILVTFNANAAPSDVVWQERDAGLPQDRFPSLVVDPTTNQIAYAVRDHFGGGHVFRTADGGVTWTNISGDLPDLPAHTIALDPRTSPNPTLYVGLDDGVYASTDLGVHWSRFGTGLPHVVVADLKLNTALNILAAGTHGRGLWEILINPPSGPTPGTVVGGANGKRGGAAFEGDFPVAEMLMHAGNDSVTSAVPTSAFQNLTGGTGNDLFVFANGAGVLIGSGGDVLAGGTNRSNILVAGGSASTLFGGTQDDLLIGGTTSYDTEAGLTGWKAIAAYWAGSDPYGTRVSNLESGTGVPLLDATTVTGNGGGNTMTGMGELALIYTDELDTISGFNAGSQQYPITP